MINSKFFGHISAIICVLIWGATFISTKILLNFYSPIEAFFYRLIIGYFALLVICPKSFISKGFKEEILYMGAGLGGVTLYFLCENIALTLSYASNISVIVATAPFLTALLTFVFYKSEKPTYLFFIGFVVSIIGIFIISFDGSTNLKLNPIGDLLAFGAALSWAFYSVLIRKISAYKRNSMAMTRRIFLYGILFMIPAIPFFNFKFDIFRFLKPEIIFNYLFLGLGASALCYVIWNIALKNLGIIKTSVYIYGVPVVTIINSIIFLDEKITVPKIIGTVFTISGLIISQFRYYKKI